ncbi:Cullin repeat-like-containing domain protein [Pisolithus microcarpus]|nr:Cullin repeat-like-containing domain protein [Pisolithus microcarpus]
MQSLRTRRPSDSRQPIKRSISKLAKSPSTRHNARKSTVDDKIKKRMSLKYAEISSPTDVSVPTVPSIPIGLRPGLARDQDEIVRDVAEVKEDPRLADQRLLDTQNFDPDACKQNWPNSTEAELKSLQSSLRSAKDDTAIELQKNVFKNYAEFVLISKEISVLENEMLELKEGLQEWKSMPSLLHIEESASVADRRRAARSSVADLRILYASQMQTLHSQISEMDGVYELNAATYKVVNMVRFVILDDAVLVARRRGGGAVAASGIGGGETAGKLVAERCWPLNEMLVLDTKDTANMTNVFKIRHGKETHVYRTEASSDKKALLGQFRQVAEELAVRKRKEREGEHERRKSLWAMGDRGSAAFNPEKLPPLPDWMAELARAANTPTAQDLSAKDKSDHDARVLSELSDNLTVAIALRDWSRAVKLAESARSHPSLAPLISALTSALLDALARPRNTKSTCVELVGHLLRLGARSKARETFLAARSEAIRRYIRAIPFEGHIGLYVHDLAVVVFTALKHTADWFLAGFVEHEMTSSFIDWAKGQIEIFAELFRKQVYSSDTDQQTVDEALKIAHTQSRKVCLPLSRGAKFLTLT